MKRSTFKTAAVAAGTVALVAALAACAPAAQEPAAAPSGGESDAPAAATPAETPEPDSFGVVVAESWKDIYPNEYQTYMANESNSPQGKQDYLTEYPELVTMYAGYGFAKGYDEAAGHPYSLQSVAETPRVNENTLANCITCKTPQYTAMVNSEGDSAYQKPFAEVLMQMTEPISCYNCHENDPTKTTVTQKFFVNSMGSDVDKVSTDSQVCGQCHNEYYFAPETKATTNPYTGLEGMTAEAILAYYDEMGFKDWEHTETGAPMLKAQHPEFETIYGGAQSSMAKQGYSCSDCHMAPAEGANGEYTSHNWVSPLENKQLIENDCSKCHDDLEKKVKDIQASEEERVTAISEKIEDMTNKIAAKYADEIAAMKAANEAKTDIPAASEELAKLQKLQRNAQFYWDFVMVENSEGAHNSKLTNETLDKAEAAADEALAMLA